MQRFENPCVATRIPNSQLYHFIKKIRHSFESKGGTNGTAFKPIYRKN